MREVRDLKNKKILCILTAAMISLGSAFPVEAGENSSIAIADFVQRYNEGVDYYNAIADRDGYNKTSYITETDLQGEKFSPTGNLKMCVNPNTTDKDNIGIINIWGEKEGLDSYVAMGETLAILYAFDSSLADGGEALDLWKKMTESAEVQQDEITFDNFSFSDLISIKAEYDGFRDNDESSEGSAEKNFLDITSSADVGKLITLEGGDKEFFETTTGVKLSEDCMISNDEKEEVYEIDGAFGDYQGKFKISFSKTGNFIYSPQFECTESSLQSDKFWGNADNVLGKTGTVKNSSAQWSMDGYTVRGFCDSTSGILMFVKSLA